mgnify:CR=1 FL=1
MATERSIQLPTDLTLSGYTTTFNCFEKRYPVRECVESLLRFCEEVVVVDAGSTDGTIVRITFGAYAEVPVAATAPQPTARRGVTIRPDGMTSPG